MPKQVIVIRRDLKMRQGKAVAQGSHASMLFLLQAVHNNKKPLLTPLQRQWADQGMAKICVRVESEEELRAIMDAALKAGLTMMPVYDSGRTEFHGVTTLTCCAIGPDVDEKIDAITGHLKLL